MNKIRSQLPPTRDLIRVRNKIRGDKLSRSLVPAKPRKKLGMNRNGVMNSSKNINKRSVSQIGSSSQHYLAKMGLNIELY